MKTYIWMLLAIGIIGFFSGFCILSKQEEVKNKEKKISLWKRIMPLILITLSSICIVFACILPYDTSQSNWSTSLNMNTNTIEINEENEYIEIIRNDNGFIKKEKYCFTGEIKGKFNNQEPKISYKGEIKDIRNSNSQKNNHSNKLKITAKEIKQESLLSSNIEYLTDVKIEYAHE